MLECLADLDERLDGRLVFRHGPPERELPALAREAKAAEMHGVDPQPFYRRMYNPARHQERFDPRGEYVRRYVAGAS